MPPLFPQNKPGAPSWLERHQGTLTKGAALAGGLTILGVGVYEAANFLYQIGCPSCGVPACVALQNSLAEIDAQIGTIYYTSSHHQNGTFTLAQASALSTLYQEQSNVIAAMQGDCPASAGAQASKTLDLVIRWAGWVARGLMVAGGIVIGVQGVRWLIRKTGGSQSDPGQPPKSIDDLGPPEEPTDPPASFGQTVAGADLADQQAAGVPGGQIEDIAANLVDTDPAVTVSSTISDFFASVAATAEEAWVAVYDALASIWNVITTVVEDLYADLLVFLGL